MYSINKTLDGDDTYYIAVPLAGRISVAVSAVNEHAIDAQTTITISDGTTTIGVITIANLSAEGTMDSIVFDGTSLGKVLVGPTKPIVAVVAGGSTDVEISLSMLIDEFHGAAV
jgi:hypothetical protein